jgi:hypothetical protein
VDILMISNVSVERRGRDESDEADLSKSSKPSLVHRSY